MTPAADPSVALPLRLTGAVWGHLVGDAMGVPYEFREPGRIGEVRFGSQARTGSRPGRGR
jgi:ADP-ribosylglycohydrolase